MYSLQKISSIIDKIPSNEGPVFFLDYDGTLVGIKTNPEDAVASENLKELLQKLSSLYRVYIITGRSLEEMFSFLGRKLSYVALHGALTYVQGSISYNVDGFESFRLKCDSIYRNNLDLIEKYPGLRMYNKSGNVLFHLGLMKEEQRATLVGIVNSLAIESGLELYKGKAIVEIRIPGVNKGTAIRKLAGGRSSIIIGDDATDEDAFRLNPEAITIHVGKPPTGAKFTLPEPNDVIELIEMIVTRS